MADTKGLTIDTPAGWWDLPLRQPDRRARIERLVDTASESQTTSTRKAALVEMLDEFARGAELQGAVLAASFSRTVGETKLGANVTVAVRRMADYEGEGELAEAVADMDFPASLSPRHVTTSVVSVPAGRAVRRQSHISVSMQGAEVAPSGVLIQYFVPFPEGGSLAVVSMSALDSSDDDREAFIILAGEMMDTFAFLSARQLESL